MNPVSVNEARTSQNLPTDSTATSYDVITTHKLIVVLGMHRSGTSAITRALKVLGVQLGDKLIPPMVGVNDKGFWENVELNTFDVELLQSLGSNWHRLTPIQSADLELLRSRGYFLRGLELLRQIIGNELVFGIKDPRVTMLLPFWKTIFQNQPEWEVSYVIAIRNPLSVAKSLAKRDGFDFEKSHLLWLGHVLASLTCTAGEKRVLIDFDQLMQAPERELKRMAAGLDLEIDPAELQIYEKEFLNKGLQHTLYRPEDLSLDDSCPMLVREVYLALTDAAGKATVDDAALHEQIDRWNKEFERLIVPLKLMDKLDCRLADATQTLSDRDFHIADLEFAVGERSKQIDDLNYAIDERLAEVARLKQLIVERDSQIAGLNQSLTQHKEQASRLDQVIAEQDGQITGLKQVSTEQMGQVSRLKSVVVERNQQIASLNETLAELKLAMAEKDNELSVIYRSKSWILTSPLRSIRRTLVSRSYFFLRKFFSNLSRWFWYSLPLSDRHKQNIKNAIFGNLPTLLGWTRAYRDWRGLNDSLAGKTRQNAPLLEAPDHKNADVSQTSEINQYVPLFKGKPLESKPAKLICFYLPQFHPIPENNAWWGEGFTEWTNVQPAEPQFAGHYQPHVPDDLGYYNLLDTAVQRRQIELAKLYGIEGFCFYFYWFAGKRLLETPVQNYLEDKSLDLPFCLCWANENWSRRWDGLDSEILIAQQHSPEDDIAFIQHVAQYMHDPRYIKIDGKPLLLVYRPSLLPSALETSERWRSWCRNHGIGEIHLAYTQSFEAVDPGHYGFDAAIEFPPNNSSPPNVTSQISPLRDDFSCNVYDWNVFVERSRHYQKPEYRLYRGVCPSWDNTARRKNKSSILLNSSPQGYQQWLLNAIDDTGKRFANPDQRLIFINAWNEWAEGAHLEPDQRYGFAYLEATRMALVRKTIMNTPDDQNNRRSIAVVIHAFYEDVFDEILGYLENIHSFTLTLYVTAPNNLVESLQRKLSRTQCSFYILPVINRGRDVLPFLKIMPEVLKGGHEFLIKVHTKKSRHRQDGDSWRGDIYEKLLLEPSLSANIEHMLTHPEIGILGPTGHIVPMSFYWGANALRVTQLAGRMGIDCDTLNSLNFVAGTMFMARIKAVIPLLNLALGDEDFEPEAGQLDGTLAHAIERLFPISAQAAQLITTCKKNTINQSYEFVGSSKG